MLDVLHVTCTGYNTKHNSLQKATIGFKVGSVLETLGHLPRYHIWVLEDGELA